MWQAENLCGPSGGLEALSYALFTRVHGWTKEEVEVFVAKAKAELKDRRLHSYFE